MFSTRHLPRSSRLSPPAAPRCRRCLSATPARRRWKAGTPRTLRGQIERMNHELQDITHNLWEIAAELEKPLPKIRPVSPGSRAKQESIVESLKALPSARSRIEVPNRDEAIIQEAYPTTSKADETTEAEPKRRRSPRTTPPGKADKTRINIISEELCDDVLGYIGGTLERHRGCDLIDISPGIGVWSEKLHDALKPRSHILLEPDAEAYQPFLEPLLKRPGVRLVPKSGIVWKELESILTPEYLPHQTELADPSEQKRNDTLLVTANIAFHPKKTFLKFSSVALLLLHQFVQASRTQSLFHKYGQVRMLVWTRSDDRASLLPQNIQKRRRLALDGELYCDWIRDVASCETEGTWYARDYAIDYSSALGALDLRRGKSRSVAAPYLSLPHHRRMEMMERFMDDRRHKRVRSPGYEPPFYARDFYAELSKMRRLQQAGRIEKGSEDDERLRRLHYRAVAFTHRAHKTFEFHEAYENMVKKYHAGEKTEAELEAMAADWNTNFFSYNRLFWLEWRIWRDNLHMYRQHPRALHWDRRAYAPLNAYRDEFFPSLDCNLMDIQPKQVDRLLTETGKGTSRSADYLDLLTGAMMISSTQPVDKVLDSLQPGAAEYIMPRWTSLRTRERPGIPHFMPPDANYTPRILNAAQWEELLRIWMDWPFKPTIAELISRTMDEGLIEDD